MTDQLQRDAALLAKDDFYSNAFGFYSHISGAVDPRTGMYSASIDLPTGNGNRLRGPHLEFRLSYSALNPNEDGFGVGWRLSFLDFRKANKGDGEPGNVVREERKRYKNHRYWREEQPLREGAME